MRPARTRTPFAPALATWPHLAVLATAILLGCGGGGGTSTCTSNSDCRSGFQCGAGPFEGDCIQVVSVEACGQGYCEKATEQCQAGTCVPRTTPLPDAGPSAPASTPDMGGISPSGATDAGTVPPVGDGGGGPQLPDARLPDQPPTVTLESPLDGAYFIDQPAELSGHVFGLIPSGRLTFRLDDDPTARPLALDGDAYHAALDVPPGRHTVVVSADQGSQHAEAQAGFRVDFRVTVSAGQLVRGGQPWRFIGVAAPDLRTLAWQQSIGGADRVAEVLGEIRRLGATVIRVPACDDRPGVQSAIQTAPGVYSEAGLQALDAVIARAGDAGLKLLLPLVDSGTTLGGVDQYLRWNGYLVPVAADRGHFYEPGPIREQVKAYVRAILARTNTVNGLAYADDPAILGWEVFTGADALGTFDAARAGAETVDFLTDVTQVMKAASPHALVSTGETGYDVNPSPYGPAVQPFRDVGLSGLFDASHGFAWQRNLQTGTVDFGGVQVVPDVLGISTTALLYANLGAQWIRGHAAVAAGVGKPLIVTLAAENRVFLDTAARRTALQAWLDEMTSQGFSGFVVGNLHADGFDTREDPHGFAWVEGTEAADPQNELTPLIQSAASALGPQ